MSCFALRKWYCDVLTSRQEFAIVYLARVSFGKAAHTSLNVAVASLENGRAIAQSWTLPGGPATPKPGEGGALREENGCWSIHSEIGRICGTPSETDIDLQLDDLRLLASHRHPRAGTNPYQSLTVCRGSHRIVWQPLALRSKVSGEVHSSRRKLQFTDADGYVDFLYSNFFPTRMPGRRVLWGRLHCPAVALAYTRMLGARAGECWQQLVVQTAEGVYSFPQFELRIVETRDCHELALRHPHRYELTADSGKFHITLAVEHLARLVQSDFLNDQPLPTRLLRRLFAWLARRPRGIKFLSRGTLQVERSQCAPILTTEFLVDEHVEFQ